MATPKVATKKLKKGRPVDTSLQVAGKQSKKSNICPLCDEPIIESGEHTKGQDAVYCEGQCKTWLHRKCAALPKSVFDQIGKSDEPFVCCYCLLVTQKIEIQSLKSLVESLNTKLLQLSNQLNSVDTPKTNNQTDTTESLVQTESRTAVLQQNVSKIILPVQTVNTILLFMILKNVLLVPQDLSVVNMMSMSRYQFFQIWTMTFSHFLLKIPCVLESIRRNQNDLDLS